MPISKCAFRNRKCRKAVRDNSPMEFDKSEPALRRLQMKSIKYNAFKIRGNDYGHGE